MDIRESEWSKCIDIINDNIIALISELPKLEVLNVSNGNFTGSGFKRMPTLKELNCSKCNQLEDDGLIRVLESATNLESLDIRGCYEITNATLNVAIEVLKNRKNNSMLEIKMDRLTDIDIHELHKQPLANFFYFIFIYSL